jgi:hypothetical protein
VPSIIPEDLELDMMRILDVFLDIDAGVAKGLFCFRPCGMEAFDEGDVVMGDPHAAAAATGHSLDHHWIATPLGDG